MEEISPEEAARRLAQLPPGALPMMEANLRRIANGLPPITSEEEKTQERDATGPFPVVPENWLKDMLQPIVHEELAKSESLADIVERMPDELLKPLPECRPVVDEWLNLSKEQEERIEKIARDILDSPKAVDLVMYISNNQKIVGKATVVNGTVFASMDENLPAGSAVAKAIMDGTLKGISVGFITRPAYPAPGDGFDDEAMSSFWNRERLGKFLFIDGIDYVGLESKPTEVDPFQEKFPYGPK